MPIGNCDPGSRGDTWNNGELAIGTVRVIYRYGWDGVSVRPDCIGPLNRLRIVNTSPDVSYWVHYRGRRGQPKSHEITPGLDRTFTQSQLRSAGFMDNTDLADMVITDSPDPPTSLPLP